MTKGIDISEWQESVDFATLKKEGASFVIIRLGCGLKLDKRFKEHYKAAKAAGFNVGAYWYNLDSKNSLNEAVMCVKTIKENGLDLDFPVWFDIEEKSSLQNANKLIETFCDYLEKSGFYCGFYTSRSSVQTYISKDILKRFDLWIAEWDVSKPNFDDAFGMWQYSNSNNKLDLDYSYKDYVTIIRNMNKKQEEPKTNKKRIKVLVDDRVVYEEEF